MQQKYSTDNEIIISLEAALKINTYFWDLAAHNKDSLYMTLDGEE